jgi:uncharacterized protein with HEPN domain
VRRDTDRLLDILEAIERIESRMVANQAAFDADEMLQVWAIHHLLILGEAASKLSEAILEEYPQGPWRKMIGMRNILVHQYFEIDTEIIWQVISVELPTLKSLIKSILNDLGSELS